MAFRPFPFASGRYESGESGNKDDSLESIFWIRGSVLVDSPLGRNVFERNNPRLTIPIIGEAGCSRGGR